GDADWSAGPGYRVTVADQFEVADAFELLVVHDATAIAKPDLWAQVKSQVCAAIGRPAGVGLSASPLIDGKGPLDLNPERAEVGLCLACRRRDCGKERCRNRQQQEARNTDHGDRRRLHAARL